jgi:hypothetical protein
VSEEPEFHRDLVEATAKGLRDCCSEWECWEDATEPSKEYYRKLAIRALRVSATWKGPVFEPQT